MKKYLILSLLFLLIAFPVVAKSTNSNSIIQGQGKNQVVFTVTPVQSQDTIVVPTSIQAKNQSQEKKLQVLNQEVEYSITKVSEEVKKFLETRGDDKTGIGQQVKVIAQNQEKIRSAFYELKNRGQLVRLFVGSDKKMTAALKELNDENIKTINKLVALKDQTVNEVDKTQIENTLGILLTQNSLLEEKINTEKQAIGLLGWFTRLFNK